MPSGGAHGLAANNSDAADAGGGRCGAISAASRRSDVAGGAGSSSSDLALRECAFDDAAMLAEIGRLRYAVWEGEGSVAPALFPDRCWVDAMDGAPSARHWVVQDGSGEVVAAARLTLHGEQDAYRDVELWRAQGVPLRWPVCDLGRLAAKRVVGARLGGHHRLHSETSGAAAPSLSNRPSGR